MATSFETHPSLHSFSGFLCRTQAAVEQLADAYVRSGEEAEKISLGLLHDGNCFIIRGNIQAFITFRGRIVKGNMGSMQVVGISRRPGDPAEIFCFMKPEGEEAYHKTKPSVKSAGIQFAKILRAKVALSA